MGQFYALLTPKVNTRNDLIHNDLFNFENDVDLKLYMGNGGLLIGNNVIVDADIIWFYQEYTLGRDLSGSNDLINIWGINKIYTTHLENKISFSINKFYFADVLIWSHSLYFLKELGSYSVYVDYGPMMQVKVANNPKDFVNNFNANWDKTFYPAI